MLREVKKWGNSLGIIVPIEVARRKGIREGDLLDVEFRRKVRTPEDLSGSVKFNLDLATLLREMEKGWDDL